MSINTTLSPIFMEIEEIINQDMWFKPYFLFETVVHTAEKNLTVFDGIFINSLHISRDYITGFADYITVELLCRVDTLVYDLYPYAKELEVTVRRTGQHRSNGQSSYTEEKFKGFWLAEENANLPVTSHASREQLAQLTPVVVTLQLIDRRAMSLRTVTVQGSFNMIVSETNKDLSPDKVMKSIMSKRADEFTVDGDYIVDGLDIERAQNKTQMETLTIPTGTKLINLPSFLQEDRGGVYTGGINTYLQSYAEETDSSVFKNLFVFSLYRGEKYSESVRQLVFYVPPSGEYNVVSHTYAYRAGTLRAFSNPIKGLDATMGNILRVQGDGFRTAHADTIAISPVEVTEDGPEYKKTGTMTEIINESQDDGLNYAPHEGISANHFAETSKVLARRGEYVKLIIDNLDPNFVYPGAPCKVVFESLDGLIQELEGVLHRASFKFDYPNLDYKMEESKETHGLTCRAMLDIYITGAQEPLLGGLLGNFF